MIEVRTRLIKWGNSVGIVVPLSKLKNTSMREGKEVRALIMEENKVDLRKMFGSHKFSKPVAQLMKETNEELYNE